MVRGRTLGAPFTALSEVWRSLRQRGRKNITTEHFSWSRCELETLRALFVCWH